MIETRRLKNVVIFFQTILSFVLSRKIILDTFSSQPSVIQIKEKTNKDVFSFRHVLPWKTYRAIVSVNQNKSTSGTIPIKVLRSLAKEICIP